MTVGVSPERVEARRILGDVARQLDRKLAVELRDIPGHDERVQVTLTHGAKQHHVELKMDEIMAAGDDSVAWHGLKLRLKRTLDTMLFRKVPDHRVTVSANAIPPPPVGGMRGKGSFGGGGRKR